MRTRPEPPPTPSVGASDPPTDPPPPPDPVFANALMALIGDGCGCCLIVHHRCTSI